MAQVRTMYILVTPCTSKLCNTFCDVPLHDAVVHVDVLREGGKEGRSKVQFLLSACMADLRYVCVIAT